MGQARLSKTRATEIADDIINRIDKEELRSGDKLPVQSVLIRQYSASSRTLAEAFDILKARSVISTRPGKGTYVK